MACGTKLRAVCPQCATELPPDPDLRFCFSCGARLVEEPPALTKAEQVAADRRLVTVLFADLAGWTQMSAAMDPEDAQTIQRAYFAAVTPPIEQHGGSVEKYIGDAVLAVFGAPQAHEDDPERAVRAALAMQGAMDDLNRKLAGTGGETPPLRLRIGVHTGLVVSRVDEDGDFVVTGDTVNLASRLQGAAEPDTVLVSAETARQVTGAFDLADLGAIPVKGKAEPIPVFRVAGIKATPAKQRGLAGLDSPLVGRQAEMAALGKVLEHLARGVGGVVTIVGEAGIGKSRLATELRRLPQTTDNRSPLAVNWVEGRCLSYGGSIAYLLWLDLLRSALRRTLDDPPETVREALRQWVERLCPGCVDDVYPYLAQLMALPLPSEIGAMIADLDGEELKRRTYQAVDAVITAAAQGQPLVIVCEDLHWADPSSLALLEHVLALTDKTGLLVVGVFRPEPEHGVWRLRETISREYRHRHTDLWLQPLSAGESETLVSNLLASDLVPTEGGQRGIPSKLIYRILAQAEGNPFYVEEVLRALIDGGVLARDAAGRWVVTQEVAEIELPATLQGVLAARIDRLQEDTRRILQLAAVIGRIFLHRVLAEIAREEQALDEKLLTLQRQELIRERARIPEMEYIFKHELTREAAYNGILKQQRRLFHRQVAEALEQLFPDRVDEMAGLLAYHWERAENASKAVEYLVRTGDQARLTNAQDEALGYYQRALVLLKPTSNHAGMARIQMRVGLTYQNAFDSEQAQQAYNQAFALWDRRQMTKLSPAPHALRLATSWGLRNVDPLTRWNTADGFWQSLLMAGLVHIGASGEVVPDLATRWDILDDGCTYLFKIHDQACWTDGAPVTAHDFVYAWRRIVSRSPSKAGLLADVRGVEQFRQNQSDELGFRALDDKTLMVELVDNRGNFLAVLSCSPLLPVPRHLVETYGDAWGEPRTLAGNGPYVLVDQQPDGSTTLVRNPTFPGYFNGNVEQIDILLLPQDTSPLPLYSDGQLDYIALRQTDLEQARRDYKEQLSVEPMRAVHFLTFNSDRSPFDDPRVRRAFALAIDKTALPMRREETAILAEGGFVPEGVPGHSPNIGLSYDPDQAHYLLEQAGYPAGRGFPAIALGAYELYAATGSRLKEQWQNTLGVEITVQPWTTVQAFDNLGSLARACHTWLYSWIAGYPDPDYFLRIWRGIIAPQMISQNDSNASPFRQLVSRAQRQTDPVRRITLYQEADRLLMAETTIVPLAYGVRHFLAKPWLRQQGSTISGIDPREMIIDPH